MIEYENLKTQPRKFLAQTSLTVAEFEDLLPAFEKASQAGVDRHRQRK